MKKAIILLSLTLLSFISFGQAIVNRSGAGNTVQDARWMAQYNAFMPRYDDTTSANLQKGIDSCGALIYTRDVAAIWFRACTGYSNRVWIQIQPAGTASGQNPWIIGGNNGLFTSPVSPQYVGTKTNQGFGLLSNNIARLTIDENGAWGLGAGLDYGTSGYVLTSNGIGVAPTWQAGGGGGGTNWNILGNAGTTPGTNFIGTTDNVDLVFKRSGIESGRIGESTSFGQSALAANTSGTENTAFGTGALQSNEDGPANTAVGNSSMATNVSGAGNTAIGNSSLLGNISGNSNTALGESALGSTTGSKNIGIGASAGTYFTSESNRVFINSLARSNKEGDSTKSIIYGAQDATAANQRLYLNSRVFLPYIPSGVGTKAVRINAGTGELTYADTTSGGSGWSLNGNTVGSEKWVGTIDGYDFPLKANNTEFQRLVPYTGTDTGYFGYVINSNYVTSPGDFATQITAAGGASSSTVAGGKELTVGATNFTQVFYIPNVWPASVLPTETYRAVGIKTAANNGLILAQEVASTAPTYWARMWVEYDFNARTATIKLTNGSGTVTLATSSALASISTGDSVACIFDWDYNQISATITNLNTSATTTVSTGFSAPNYAPTVYLPCMFFPLTTNPTVLQSLQVYIEAYKNPDFNFVGHSVLQGYSGVTRAELAPELIRDFMPNYKIQIDAMGSMKIADVMLWKDEIEKIHATYVPLMIGANDAGTSDATFYSGYRALRDTIVAGGSQVIHFGQLPQTGYDFTARNDSLKTLYESLGDIFIDIFPLLKNGSGYDYLPYYDVGDGIHPSAAGDSLIASQFMLAIAPLIGAPVSQDYVDFSKILNLQGTAFYQNQQIFNSDRALVDKGYVDSSISAGSGTVTNFNFTDANGFDGTVTNSSSTPTLSLTTTVGDARVLLSNSGALTGSADFKYNTTDKTMLFGGQTTSSWSNISSALMGGNATIMFGQSTDMWLSSNAKFNSGWRYLANGYAANIGVFQQDVQLRAANTASAGDALTWIMPIKATYSSGGVAGIGGDITTTGGAITGATIGAYPTRVGIAQPTYIGDISTSAGAWLHIRAGSATAGTAPIKITSGALNTVPVVGQAEYNDNWYLTNNSINRMGMGGVIADFISTVDNSGTGETDLYTYTTKANTFVNNSEKIEATYSGTFNDNTATATLKVLFGGVNIANTGALTVSATGSWSAKVLIIKTGTTTARAVVDIITPTASSALYTLQTDLTGLDFTVTNILKITGTAGGGGGGSADISAKLGTISFHAAANN